MESVSDCLGTDRILTRLGIRAVGLVDLLGSWMDHYSFLILISLEAPQSSSNFFFFFSFTRTGRGCYYGMVFRLSKEMDGLTLEVKEGVWSLVFGSSL